MGVRSMGRIGGVAAIGSVGFGLIDGGLTYYDRRQQHPDESVAKSATIAGTQMAGWSLMPGVMFAYEGYNMAKAAGEAGVFNRQMQEAKRMQYFQQGASWNYNDTQTAATMRQRGLEAITQGRMTAKSALGGEARSLHRRGAL